MPGRCIRKRQRFCFHRPTSAAVVTFRNVIFDGAAGGGGAVQITGGKVVFENCTFQNFTASPGEAVQFAPTVAGAQLTITDSVFTNNGIAGSGGGIIIQPSAGVTAGAVIERTQVTGNTYGIVANGIAGGTALVEVRYSTIANSVFDGIWADTSGSTASIVVEHSASVRNGGNGINAQGAGAYVSLRDSTVDWNATGLTTSGGGLILSYQNNLIAGNLSPGVTPAERQPAVRNRAQRSGRHWCCPCRLVRAFRAAFGRLLVFGDPLTVRLPVLAQLGHGAKVEKELVSCGAYGRPLPAPSSQVARGYLVPVGDRTIGSALSSASGRPAAFVASGDRRTDVVNIASRREPMAQPKVQPSNRSSRGMRHAPN